MTTGRTREARTGKIHEMENRHRINLESRDLLILNISIENSQGWRAWDVEYWNTSWDKGVWPTMPSARNATK